MVRGLLEDASPDGGGRQTSAPFTRTGDPVGSRFFKRRWEESRGDEYDAWGASTWYFEIGEDSFPIRQVEIYDRGPTLRYGPEHDEDQYGFLSYAKFDDDEDWTPWEIPRAQFELAWNQADYN